MEQLLPTLMKSRTESDAPSFVIPYKDNVEDMMYYRT